jgi:hypothetical protein
LSVPEEFFVIFPVKFFLIQGERVFYIVLDDFAIVINEKWHQNFYFYL